MDPVNIDFIIGGNVDKEAPKAKDALDGVADAGKKAIEQTQQRIIETKSNIAQVESDLKKLQQSYERAAPGKQKDFFARELSEARKALEEEKKILTEIEAKVNTAAGSHSRLRTQVMNLKEEFSRLEMQGKRNTPEYRKMSEELGRLNKQMKDTAMQANILADDQKGFRAVASGVSGLAGAMSAAVGVGALLGSENEELTRIQTRLQAVMAITIGLQQVSEMLNKKSYFSVALLTKAKTWWAATNLKVAASLGVSTLAAKALMAALTLGLSVAITGLVIMLDKVITKNKEKKKSAQEAAKAQLEAAKSAAEEYGKELVKVESLRAALSSENVTRSQKLAIINKLKGIMPGYTAELDKEGRVIRENKTAVDDYMVSLEKSIRLKAEEQKLSELFSKRYQQEQKTFERPIARTIEEADFLDRQESDFNAFKAGELAKIDKAIDEVKQRINQGGLISIITPDTPKAIEKKGGFFDAAKAIQQQLLEINRQTSDLLFAQREDNLQKTLDAIDQEKDAELAKIKQNEKDIVDKYNQANKDKAGFKTATSIADIDSKLAAENQQAITQLQAAYTEKRMATEQQYFNDLKRLAAEAADSRVKIENDYEGQIKRAREAGFDSYAKLLEAERDNKISQATTATITEMEAYKLASNDHLNLSKETTEKLIDMIRQRVEAELEAGKISKQNAQEILDSVSGTNAGGGQSNNPFQNLIDGLQKYKEARENLSAAKVAGGSIEDLAKFEDAANKALQSTAATAGVAFQGVVNILSQAVDGLAQLGLLAEDEKETANEVIGMVAGAANLAMGIASGNPVQIIQGSIELLVNGLKLFDKKTKEIEKAQRQAIKNVNELERAYAKLQRAVDKALGTDAYKFQREQIELLQKKIREHEAWIEAERKKKKKKQNEEAIAERQALIDEETNKINSILSNVAESLAQTNVKDMATELADSLVSAFRQGESAAEAMGEVIDNVIRKAVVNSLKLRYLEKPLQSIIDSFAEDMESGGGLDNKEAKKFRDAIEALGNDFFKAFEEANKALDGIFSTSTSTTGGIKGDVANMSEQTGSALVGQLAAMRLNVAAILATSKNSGEAISRIFATMERIKENTEFCRRLERIDENLQYLKINGIDVK